eukprot:TRINITY_DN24050_c0_g1_i2.p1 TRINITY_DN24050_c0_g1~~TRINITY_DN24050_c0_g1_i2.p1  ORF type:complete len:435 (+),score=55.90 TRINITY_DN24050_c0_g1_i2:50-1306(+)
MTIAFAALGTLASASQPSIGKSKGAASSSSSPSASPSLTPKIMGWTTFCVVAAAGIMRRRRTRRLVPQATAQEAKAESAKSAGAAALGLSLICLLSTVMNRMTFRFVLVPMGRVTHLLSVTTNLVYIAFFASVVQYKMKSGAITSESWDFATKGRGRWLLLCAGLAECTAFTLMPLFARNLPGSMLAILSQSMIPFSMLFSIIAFKRSYDSLQYIGVAIVLAGIGVCSYPKAVAEAAVLGSDGSGLAKFLANSVGLLLSYSFIAASFIFKEKCFKRFSAESTSGSSLDGNVVNLAAALCQCGALWVLWPFNFKFITPLSPAEYFGVAKGVFTSASAAAVVALYWIANIYYLGASLTVVQKLSSVIALLVGAVAVPISALLFCFNWPVLGAETFTGYTVAGLLVIFGGLLTYNHKSLGR